MIQCTAENRLMNGQVDVIDHKLPKDVGNISSTSNSEDEEYPAPRPGDSLEPMWWSPVDAESYFRSLKSSRANSVASSSRVSFSAQLSQLTSLNLPNASSLSASISAIPKAPAAARALTTAAEQIRQWVQKAKEVLSGLEAEDDVEWAAAAGREGLGDVDSAVDKFAALVEVYVAAIEGLQARDDISDVSVEGLKTVVEQMEKTLKDWENLRSVLKAVKAQVESAMEWEELWNVVLGDIGLEIENLGRLIFEMEEIRHRVIMGDGLVDGTPGVDIQELETIVEEAPVGRNHRFSLPPTYPESSPIMSPGTPGVQEDSRLLALFARMQPLRASLDFLPIRLSNFHSRAKDVLPTACEEIESRRRTLERKWKKLEKDANGLRQELGEDRWVTVFRNAGRQAQKMCESVERSINKLQEAIDVGAQHSNPPALAKKVENYEAKKTHYGPSIQRVLAIIEKGVKDRLTVNGEILRLHHDMQTKWSSVEAEMKDMDLALEDLAKNKSQQLRDSISSILSMDPSAPGSGVETPGSSPGSSDAMGPLPGKPYFPSSAAIKSASRRSSIMSNNTSRPTSSHRVTSMPLGSFGTSQLPNKAPVPKAASSNMSSRVGSPSPYAPRSSATPTPGTRSQRPPMRSDGKPRWNSSPKVDHTDPANAYKPYSHIHTPPNRKSPMTFRTASYSSSTTLPSPLGRETSSSPAPHSNPLPRSRPILGPPSTSSRHEDINASPSPAHLSRANVEVPHLRLKTQSSYPNITTDQRRRSLVHSSLLASNSINTPEGSLSANTKPQRPTTSMANNRRISMLPIPRTPSGGRDSPVGTFWTK